MIKVTRIKPGDYAATVTQLNNLASECLATAFFDTHIGAPCITIQFTFPDETTDFGALVMMGNFIQTIKHLKRPFHERQFHY